MQCVSGITANSERSGCYQLMGHEGFHFSEETGFGIRHDQKPVLPESFPRISLKRKPFGFSVVQQRVNK